MNHFDLGLTEKYEVLLGQHIKNHFTQREIIFIQIVAIRSWWLRNGVVL
jgi:hypothetical protein